jgi:hypothetical protein
MVMRMVEAGSESYAIRFFIEQFFPLTFKGNSTISNRTEAA